MNYQDEILNCPNTDDIHILLSEKLEGLSGPAQQQLATDFTETVKFLIASGRITIQKGRIDYLKYQGVELPFFMSGTIVTIK